MQNIKVDQKIEEINNIVKAYYEALFENSETAIIIIQEDGTISQVNNEFENLCGYSKDEIEDKKSFEELLLKNEAEKLRTYHNLKCYNSQVTSQTYQSYIVHKNSDILSVYVTITPISYTKECLISLKDITKLKKIKTDLRTSIKEKEVLLRELNHRVKNNLQMIYSLLHLEESYVNGEESIKLLESTENRVRALIFVQNMVHESSNLSIINFSAYIQKLVLDMLNVYGAKNNIKPVFNMDQISFNIETTIPCGLIVSEIIYNTIKHAFPNNETGKITLDFHSCSDEEFELIIHVPGKNLPQNINFNNKNSFELVLIQMLVKQLDSALEIDRSPGTTFKIKFKELSYKERK
jgi:two-component system, sensor histidine kinase PdtaS